MDDFVAKTVLKVGERGRARDHHRSIEFWNSPKVRNIPKQTLLGRYLLVVVASLLWLGAFRS
jgi:hypothetical protein